MISSSSRSLRSVRGPWNGGADFKGLGTAVSFHFRTMAAWFLLLFSAAGYTANAQVPQDLRLERPAAAVTVQLDDALPPGAIIDGALDFCRAANNVPSRRDDAPGGKASSS